jgi:cytochrome c oxidase assembly factor CtaG
MLQHLVLILVAAPLLVFGAPERVALWAFPLPARRRLGGWAHALGRALGPLGRPGPAVAMATAGLWIWHVPALYDLAVERGALHALEHLTFLLTAVLFWWTLLRIRTRRADKENGGRILALLAMVVQGSLLGALITFAAAPLYDSHRAIPRAWGVGPLVDQQLAGLIMWVPPAALYLAVGGWLLAGLLRSVEDA